MALEERPWAKEEEETSGEHLSDAEKCIEDIDRLFAKDPFEEISRRKSSGVASKSFGWNRRFGQLKEWRGFIITAIAFGGGGFFLGSFLEGQSAGPLRREGQSAKQLDEKPKASIREQAFLATTPAPGSPLASPLEGPLAELAAPGAPEALIREAAPGAGEGSIPRQPPPAPAKQKLPLPAATSLDKPVHAVPPATDQTAQQKEDALKEIAFAEEVLEGLKATRSDQANTQTKQAIDRAKELVSQGKYTEAAGLARQTAEKLLVE